MSINNIKINLNSYINEKTNIENKIMCKKCFNIIDEDIYYLKKYKKCRKCRNEYQKKYNGEYARNYYKNNKDKFKKYNDDIKLFDEKIITCNICNKSYNKENKNHEISKRHMYFLKNLELDNLAKCFQTQIKI